jgi:hypothetical protein
MNPTSTSFVPMPSSGSPLVCAPGRLTSTTVVLSGSDSAPTVAA